MKKNSLLIFIVLLVSILVVLPLVSCKKEIDPEIVEEASYKFVEGSSMFIEMGEYPQTIATDVTIADIKSQGTYDETTGYYTYNNEKYKIITANPNASIDSVAFSNEESVVAGQEYAFKVEKIVWKIINKQLKEEDYLLYSTKVLDSTYYQDEDAFGASSESVVNYYLYDENHNLQIKSEVYANNYELSILRQKLTNFYEQAFSDANKKAIKKVTVDNSSTKASSSW